MLANKGNNHTCLKVLYRLKIKVDEVTLRLQVLLIELVFLLLQLLHAKLNYRLQIKQLLATLIQGEPFIVKKKLLAYDKNSSILSENNLPNNQLAFLIHLHLPLCDL